MNYIAGTHRKQLHLESYEDCIDADNEVRVIDKVVDALNIEVLGFIIGN